MITADVRYGRRKIAGLAVALVLTPWWTTGATACGPSGTDSAASGATAVARRDSAYADDVYYPSGADAAAPSATALARRDSTYADGVYADTGWYGGQPSSIGVTVTLADGVVTALRVTPHATVPQSLELQRRFADAVPAVVVGKRLDEVNVGRLAGSSGTPRGFNDAIRKIREQARRKPEGDGR
jgi:uncharacterized protein with FMN-binding domain